MAFASRLFFLSQLALAIAVCPSAMADETGLSDIHDQRREGGRICMTSHFHYGSGSGATKAAAQHSAIASWASFTAFEYGSDWASFRQAGSKGMNCRQSGQSWSCSLQARPCKKR
jgi:hypothetical protein